MEKTPVIGLENVSVCYQVPRERIGTLKEFAIRWLQRRVQMESFWALRDFSLEVHQGEILGIIGPNGAGKSTLLKLISRVLTPTSGRVWVNGLVAPLLELGAGFHPELTGRENVFLNGAMLGFSHREMESRLDEILAFSELGDFIEAPIRTYSSGMWARLGFSVATSFRPDILIIDEILAVGDESFQKKCNDRIKEFVDKGTTILMVSHALGNIESTCSRAVWISHGKLMSSGRPADVIDRYRSFSG